MALTPIPPARNQATRLVETRAAARPTTQFDDNTLFELDETSARESCLNAGVAVGYAALAVISGAASAYLFSKSANEESFDSKMLQRAAGTGGAVMAAAAVAYAVYLSVRQYRQSEEGSHAPRDGDIELANPR